jgi:hypothetical protein
LIAASHVAVAPVYPAPAAAATSLRERILLVVRLLAVLASSVAFIEPSPHDALMGVLAIAAMIAGVRFERTLLVPLILLMVWNLGGLLALLNVLNEEKTILYAVTSVYLAVAAMIFAMIFAQNSMRRLTVMRVAYVITAVLATIAGAIGYFQLFGMGEILAASQRAAGGFKDPNVFGPFLIWPALFLLDRMVARRIYFTDAIVASVILFGLLLSFSRGAWFHFGLSCAVMIALDFATAPTLRARARVITFTVAAVAVAALLFLFLLSFDSIGEMFKVRAQLIQDYDVGSGGRFRMQELALTSLLSFPGGMGPFEFARVNGLQQHNVYLQSFLVYGWTGAMAYLMLLLSTVFVGLRAALVRTPWQPYLITALAAFIGEMAEGFIIDTDHWRHFFLLLGIVWGLSAATIKAVREQRTPPPFMRAAS